MQNQRCRIDAVAQTGWRWAVGKYMPQVCVARSAHHFGAPHQKRIVGVFGNRIFGNRFEKRRPASARIKFCRRIKQTATAAHATINTVRFAVVIGASKCPLGAFLAGYLILQRREFLAQGVVVQLHRTRCAGRHRNIWRCGVDRIG